jgi:hypothetical protein
MQDVVSSSSGDADEALKQSARDGLRAVSADLELAKLK